MVPAMKPRQEVNASYAPMKIKLLVELHQYGAAAGKTFELLVYQTRRVPL